MKNIEKLIENAKGLESQLLLLKQEVSNSEEHLFSSIVNCLPGAIIIIQNGKFVYLNPYAVSLLGYSDYLELAGNNFIDYIHKDDRELLRERMKNTEKKISNPPIKFKLIRKNNTICYSEATSIPFVYNGKSATLIVSKDVTKETELKTELNLSRSRLKDAEILASAGHYTICMDTSSMSWSTGTYNLLSWPEELKCPDFETYKQWIHPDDLQEVISFIDECLKSPSSSELIFRVYDYHRHLKYIKANCKSVTNGSCKNMIFGSVVDVTASYMTELELRESEKYYKKILASINDAVFITDINGNFLFVCSDSNGIFEYTTEEIKTLKNICMLIPGSIELLKKFRNKKKLNNEEINIITSSGKNASMLASLDIFNHSDNSLIWTIRDVTELRVTYDKLNEALNVSMQKERELNALFKATKAIPSSKSFSEISGIIFRECKDLVKANAGFIILLDKYNDHNDVIYLDPENSTYNFVYGLQIPVKGLIARAYTCGYAIFHNDFRRNEWGYELPEGHPEIDNLLFAPLNFGEETIGLIGLANKEGGFDENDAKTAEAFGDVAAVALKFWREQQRLFESEEKYKNLVEQAPIGVGITKDDKVVYFNTTLLKIYGYDSMDGLPGRPLVEFVHKDDRLKVLFKLEEAKKGLTKYPYYLELKVSDRNGKIKYLLFFISSMVIRGEKYAQTFVQDISDKKLQERNRKKIAADLLYINQKNSILLNIHNNMEILDKKTNLNEFKEWSEIREIIRNNLNFDKDWEKLKLHFQEVHQDFYDTLNEKHPRLSVTEMKLCAYIKLNLNTKEIARIMNINPSSVQTSRVRLKKRLGLESNVNLIQYIHNL